MFEFDLAKVLLSVGGLAGIAGIIEVIANSVQILDWIKQKFIRQTNNGKGSNLIIEIPHNLPNSSKLIGRKQLAKKICSSVDKNVLTVIMGRGGIGKSSLALETVKRYYLSRKKQHFIFDAIVWVSAKNEEITFSGFLDTVARVMGYTGVLQITDLEYKSIEVKQLFQKNRILLIVDNFETISGDIRIVDFIENVCDNDRVIITTRENLIWNISSRLISVEKLDNKEGISLIKHEYKKQELDFKSVSSEALSELLQATDGSPLAIKWAVGQIATNRIPIERIIVMLQAGQGDVFEKMFSSSWKSLDGVSRGILYKLLFFSPVATREALYHVTELDEFSFDICISKLSRLSLVEVNGENISTQSYGFHPLTKSFVERMKEEDNITDETFYKPVINYYVRFCSKYGEIGTIAAFDKLENELSNIYRVINWIKQYSIYTEYLISIVSSISVFLWSRGYWIKRVEYSNLAVEFAMSCGNTKQAIIHEYYIGIVKFWQGNLGESAQAVARCRELNRNINDSICNALILRLEALIHIENNSELSINNFMQVLETLKTADNRDVKLFADWRVDSDFGYKAGIVAIYQELGITNNRNNNHLEAIKWLNKSLALAEEISDSEGQAVSLSHLGFSYIGLDDYATAKALCLQGLELALQVNRKSTIGRCYQVLAISETMFKRKRKARKYAKSALEMFERLGMEHESNEIKRYVK